MSEGVLPFELCLKSINGDDVSVQIDPGETFQQFIDKTEPVLGYVLDVNSITNGDEISLQDDMYTYLMKIEKQISQLSTEDELKTVQAGPADDNNGIIYVLEDGTPVDPSMITFENGVAVLNSNVSVTSSLNDDMTEEEPQYTVVDDIVYKLEKTDDASDVKDVPDANNGGGNLVINEDVKVTRDDNKTKPDVAEHKTHGRLNADRVKSKSALKRDSYPGDDELLREFDSSVRARSAQRAKCGRPFHERHHGHHGDKKNKKFSRMKPEHPRQTAFKGRVSPSSSHRIRMKHSRSEGVAIKHLLKKRHELQKAELEEVDELGDVKATNPNLKYTLVPSSNSDFASQFCQFLGQQKHLEYDSPNKGKGLKRSVKLKSIQRADVSPATEGPKSDTKDKIAPPPLKEFKPQKHSVQDIEEELDKQNSKSNDAIGDAPASKITQYKIVTPYSLRSRYGSPPAQSPPKKTPSPVSSPAAKARAAFSIPPKLAPVAISGPAVKASVAVSSPSKRASPAVSSSPKKAPSAVSSPHRTVPTPTKIEDSKPAIEPAAVSPSVVSLSKIAEPEECCEGDGLDELDFCHFCVRLLKVESEKAFVLQQQDEGTKIADVVNERKLSQVLCEGCLNRGYVAVDNADDALGLGEIIVLKSGRPFVYKKKSALVKRKRDIGKVGAVADNVVSKPIAVTTVADSTKSKPVTVTTDAVMSEPVALTTDAVMSEPVAITTDAVMSEPVAVTADAVINEPVAVMTDSVMSEPVTVMTDAIMSEPVAVTTDSVTKEPVAVATDAVKPTSMDVDVNTVEATTDETESEKGEVADTIKALKEELPEVTVKSVGMPKTDVVTSSIVHGDTTLGIKEIKSVSKPVSKPKFVIKPKTKYSDSEESFDLDDLLVERKGKSVVCNYKTEMGVTNKEPRYVSGTERTYEAIIRRPAYSAPNAPRLQPKMTFAEFRSRHAPPPPSPEKVIYVNDGTLHQFKIVDVNKITGGRIKPGLRDYGSAAATARPPRGRQAAPKAKARRDKDDLFPVIQLTKIDETIPLHLGYAMLSTSTRYGRAPKVNRRYSSYFTQSGPEQLPTRADFTPVSSRSKFSPALMKKEPLTPSQKKEFGRKYAGEGAKTELKAAKPNVSFAKKSTASLKRNWEYKGKLLDGNARTKKLKESEKSSTPKQTPTLKVTPTVKIAPLVKDSPKDRKSDSTEETTAPGGSDLDKILDGFLDPSAENRRLDSLAGAVNTQAKNSAPLYTCRLCGKNIQHLTLVVSHSIRHQNLTKKEFPCILCTNSYNDYRSVSQHIKKDHGSPFKAEPKREESAISANISAVSSDKDSKTDSAAQGAVPAGPYQEEEDDEVTKAMKSMFGCGDQDATSAAKPAAVKPTAAIKPTAVEKPEFASAKSKAVRGAPKLDDKPVEEKKEEFVVSTGPPNRAEKELVEALLAAYDVLDMDPEILDLLKSNLLNTIRLSAPETKTSQERTGETLDCLLCREKFQTPAELKVHNCGKETKRRSPVRSSRLLSDSSSMNLDARVTHQCSRCGQVRRDMSRLKFHLRFHEPPYLYQDPIVYGCRLCSAIYSGEEELFVHMRMSHISELGKKMLPINRALNIFGGVFVGDKTVGTTSLSRRERRARRKMMLPSRCSVCLKKVPRQKLRTHTDDHATFFSDEAVYYCIVCFRCFQDRQCAENHSTVAEKCINTKEKCPSIVNQRNRFNLDDGGAIQNVKKLRKLNDSLSERSKRLIGVRFFRIVLKCEFCNAAFINKAALRDHWKTHSADKGQFKCEWCFSVFSAHGRLMAHMIAECIERPNPKTDFSKNKLVRSNVPLDLDFPVSRLYLCTDCDKTFLHWTHLKSHKRIAHSKCTVKCAECPMTFRSLWSLNNHRICRHQLKDEDKVKIRTYKCSDCKVTSTSEKVITDHWKLAHGGFPCPLCGMKFATKRWMEFHEKSHEMEKSFPCMKCKRVFTQSAQLREHLVNVHRSNIEFKCVKCPKSFLTESSLKIHYSQKHSTGKMSQLAAASPAALITPTNAPLEEVLKGRSGDRLLSTLTVDSAARVLPRSAEAKDGPASVPANKDGTVVKKEVKSGFREKFGFNEYIDRVLKQVEPSAATQMSDVKPVVTKMSTGVENVFRVLVHTPAPASRFTPKAGGRSAPPTVAGDAAKQTPQFGHKSKTKMTRRPAASGVKSSRGVYDIFDQSSVKAGGVRAGQSKTDPNRTLEPPSPSPSRPMAISDVLTMLDARNSPVPQTVDISEASLSGSLPIVINESGTLNVVLDKRESDAIVHLQPSDDGDGQHAVDPYNVERTVAPMDVEADGAATTTAEPGEQAYGDNIVIVDEFGKPIGNGDVHMLSDNVIVTTDGHIVVNGQVFKLDMEDGSTLNLDNLIIRQDDDGQLILETTQPDAEPAAEATTDAA